jgi:glutathione S-transferase
MLTVHHLGISQSERIVWLCEELEIPYQLVRYDRDPNTRLAPEQYKVLHPFGTAPVITDGRMVLGESGAIMEYILAKHGGGRLVVGADEPNFADYLFWFHFANGSFMPSAMTDIVVTIMGGVEGTAPHVINALRSRGQRAWQMTEARLEEVRLSSRKRVHRSRYNQRVRSYDTACLRAARPRRVSGRSGLSEANRSAPCLPESDAEGRAGDEAHDRLTFGVVSLIPSSAVGDPFPKCRK